MTCPYPLSKGRVVISLSIINTFFWPILQIEPNRKITVCKLYKRGLFKEKPCRSFWYENLRTSFNKGIVISTIPILNLRNVKGCSHDFLNFDYYEAQRIFLELNKILKV